MATQWKKWKYSTLNKRNHEKGAAMLPFFIFHKGGKLDEQI